MPQTFQSSEDGQIQIRHVQKVLGTKDSGTKGSGLKVNRPAHRTFGRDIWIYFSTAISVSKIYFYVMKSASILQTEDIAHSQSTSEHSDDDS
jgi:hypothetical protein